MKMFLVKFNVLGKAFRIRVPASSSWEAWEKAREQAINSIARAEIIEENKDNDIPDVLKDIFKL